MVAITSITESIDRNYNTADNGYGILYDRIIKIKVMSCTYYKLSMTSLMPYLNELVTKVTK